jgi:SanA protein
MRVIGFNARDVEGRGGRKTKVRELGARVMMWLDLHVLHTEPKHLGPRIILPL